MQFEDFWSRGRRACLLGLLAISTVASGAGDELEGYSSVCKKTISTLNLPHEKYERQFGKTIKTRESLAADGRGVVHYLTWKDAHLSYLHTAAGEDFSLELGAASKTAASALGFAMTNMRDFVQQYGTPTEQDSNKIVYECEMYMLKVEFKDGLFQSLTLTAGLD